MKRVWVLIWWAFFMVSGHGDNTVSPVGESEFLAAKITGEQIANWLEKLEGRPEVLGIFQVNTNRPLMESYAQVVETEVIKSLRQAKFSKVVPCPECKVPQLLVQEDRIVITKGSPDMESLVKLSKKYNVNAFLSIEVYRTTLAVMSMATLFNSATGEVVATESFRVPALEIGDSATQILLQVGIGVPLGGQDLDPDESTTDFSASLGILEELGFGKGGLIVGGASGNKSTLVYIVPTVGWRSLFGGTSLQTLTTMGLGFGYSEGSQGLMLRGGYDLFFGSFVGIGLEGGFLVPFSVDESKEDNVLNGFIGFHINFSLGR